MGRARLQQSRSVERPILLQFRLSLLQAASHQVQLQHRLAQASLRLQVLLQGQQVQAYQQHQAQLQLKTAHRASCQVRHRHHRDQEVRRPKGWPNPLRELHQRPLHRQDHLREGLEPQVAFEREVRHQHRHLLLGRLLREHLQLLLLAPSHLPRPRPLRQPWPVAV